MTVVTIVDVVEASMGILRIINNEGTPETVTVLRGQVTVVPESTFV